MDKFCLIFSIIWIGLAIYNFIVGNWIFGIIELVVAILLFIKSRKEKFSINHTE